MERTNIDAMRQVSFADFLARSGHEPVRRSGNELWYHTPYRNERAPSFRVNVAKRLWYNFDLGKGGDIFTLAGEFARSGDFVAQAGFTTGTMRMPFVSMKEPLYLPEPPEPAFGGVKAVPLLHSPLISYLVERGIPYAVVSRHCYRLNYGVHGKRYLTVGFLDMADGYKIQSRYFKSCMPPKDMSLIKPKDTASDVYSVFEGLMDFLSADTLSIGGNGDSLVLNSVANVGKAAKHLDGYGRIDCFLDRDESRRRALEVLKGHYDGCVCGRSAFYSGCKNLSEYLQRTARREMNNNLKIKGQ